MVTTMNYLTVTLTPVCCVCGEPCRTIAEFADGIEVCLGCREKWDEWEEISDEDLRALLKDPEVWGKIEERDNRA